MSMLGINLTKGHLINFQIVSELLSGINYIVGNHCENMLLHTGYTENKQSLANTIWPMSGLVDSKHAHVPILSSRENMWWRLAFPFPPQPSWQTLSQAEQKQSALPGWKGRSPPSHPFKLTGSRSQSLIFSSRTRLASTADWHLYVQPQGTTH